MPLVTDRRRKEIAIAFRERRWGFKTKGRVHRHAQPAPPSHLGLSRPRSKRVRLADVNVSRLYAGRRVALSDAGDDGAV